jgi:hypothetical protein
VSSAVHQRRRRRINEAVRAMEGSPTVSYSSKAHGCPPTANWKRNLAATKWKHMWRIPPCFPSSHNYRRTADRSAGRQSGAFSIACKRAPRCDIRRASRSGSRCGGRVNSGVLTKLKIAVFALMFNRRPCRARKMKSHPGSSPAEPNDWRSRATTAKPLRYELRSFECARPPVEAHNVR